MTPRLWPLSGLLNRAEAHALKPDDTITQLLDDADERERLLAAHTAAPEGEAPASSSVIRHESHEFSRDRHPAAQDAEGADAPLDTGGSGFAEVFSQLLDEHERSAEANAAGELREHGIIAAPVRRREAAPQPVPPAPALATGPGDLVFIFGMREDALTTAQALTLAHPGLELGVGGTIGRPGSRHVGGRREATQARADGVRRGTGTLVAIGVGDAPGDAEQYASVLADVVPDQVWIAVDVTRKPEDTRLWAAEVAEAGGGIDAVAAIGTAYTSTPDSTELLGIPVGWSDGGLT